MLCREYTFPRDELSLKLSAVEDAEIPSPSVSRVHGLLISWAKLREVAPARFSEFFRSRSEAKFP